MSLLAGTGIATPRGPIPVEALKPGDTVLLSTGREAEVRWNGVRTVFRDLLRTARMKRFLPVRIEPGALDEGVPAAPLLASPDQALATAGGFVVPARDLANNMTIREDRAADRYRFHAIALAEPGYVMAEGVAAESYAGRESPNSFMNAADYPKDDGAPQRVPSLRIAMDRWHALRHALRGRAEAMGWTLTADPDLRFDVDGTQLPGTRTGDRSWRLDLPGSGTRIAIASRGWMPAADSAPFMGDDRTLGVPVQQVRLVRDDVSLVIRPGALTGMPGFYISERTHIWSNGFALLPPALLAALEGFQTVELDLFETGLRYAAPPGPAADQGG